MFQQKKIVICLILFKFSAARGQFYREANFERHFKLQTAFKHLYSVAAVYESVSGRENINTSRSKSRFPFHEVKCFPVVFFQS